MKNAKVVVIGHKPAPECAQNRATISSKEYQLWQKLIKSVRDLTKAGKIKWDADPDSSSVRIPKACVEFVLLTDRFEFNPGKRASLQIHSLSNMGWDKSVHVGFENEITDQITRDVSATL